MSSSEATLHESTAQLHYYLQKRLYKEATVAAKNAHNRFDDTISGLWAAYALFKGGASAEALAYLSGVDRSKEAGAFGQRVKALLSGETAPRLDALSRQSMSDGLLSALVLLNHYEDGDKVARELAKSSLNGGYQLEQAKAVLELFRHAGEQVQPDSVTRLEGARDLAQRSLEKAEELKPNNPFTCLLKIELAAQKKSVQEMSELVNKLPDIVQNETFLGLQRAEFYLAAQKWDAFSTTLDSLLGREPNNILALRFKLFESLVCSGSMVTALQVYSQIAFLVEKEYGCNNLPLLLESVQFVNRVGGNTPMLLQTTINILSKVRKTNGDNYGVLSELGYAYLLAGDLSTAEETYQKASKVDSNQTDPMLRLVQVKLYKGELEEAEASLDFFKEISSTLKQDSSEIYFLEAFLAFSKAQKLKPIAPLANFSNVDKSDQPMFDSEREMLFAKSEELFDEAISAHVSLTKSLPTNTSFYTRFNPSFLMELGQAFSRETENCFVFAKFNAKQFDLPSTILFKSIKVLELLIKRIPGLIAGFTALSRVQILAGDLSSAEANLAQIFTRDPLNQTARIQSLFIALLKALESGSVDDAVQNLTSASSINFDLLQNAEFLYLKAQVEILKEDFEGAKNSLQRSKQVMDETMSVSRVGNNESGLYAQNNTRNSRRSSTLQNKTAFKESLRAKVECELAIVRAKQGDIQEARKMLQETIQEYAGTQNSIYVLLANSELAVVSKDIKTAIDILKNVEPSEKGFALAKSRLAEIYLEHLKQARSFVQCFQEIMENFPSAENLRRLAEALFKVSEFAEARELFEKVESQFGSSIELSLKIGECLLKTHNYARAKSYFLTLVKSEPQILGYRVFLCELLRKTRSFSEIISVLNLELIKSSGNSTENPGVLQTNEMQLKVSASLLLFEYYRQSLVQTGKQEDFKKAQESLEVGLDFQSTLLETLKSRNLKVEAARKKIAEINFKIVELYQLDGKGIDLTTPFLEEAIKFDPENQNYHLFAGELFLAANKIDLAKEKAKLILKTDFKQPRAVALLADCLLREQQTEGGIKGFLKIYEKDQQLNNSTTLLTTLIWFYRSAGRLPEFQTLLKSRKKPFESKNTHFSFSGNDSALSYASGAYFYSIRNFNAAVEELSKARLHPDFNGTASLLLVDIYLHDNSFNLFSNFFHKEKFKAVKKQNLAAIKIILGGWTSESHKPEKEIFEIALRFLEDPSNCTVCEEALQKRFHNPFYNNQKSLLVYFLILLNIRLKDKARLKDLLVYAKDLEFQPRACLDEYFFRTQLLCCDVLLSKEKLKPAKIVIDGCLKVNRSCLAAFEYLLVFNEKSSENNTSVLQTCFDATSGQDPNLGYKLAKALMEGGSAVESFKICKGVLDLYPRFKSIESDVMLKVREELINNY